MASTLPPADSGDAVVLPKPIPMNQLGAVAGQQYAGDGLAVEQLGDGAQLRCVFQLLTARATPDGLWITSTTGAAQGVPLRVKAAAVGRRSADGVSSHSGAQTSLTQSGTVAVLGQLVRFTRAGLSEEYSVSMDGVRQDFIIEERPPGEGGLCVALAVDGATARQTPQGAHLVLPDDSRTIAYHRLEVMDAEGKVLPAALRVRAENQLAVEVEDSAAVYPVRIDPTFSDANWSSMGGLPGANAAVNAMVVNAAGDLYVGGGFTVIGDTNASWIAKWNGTGWSALGWGLDGPVSALASSGTNLYVGGAFGRATNNGGQVILANSIARWDGNNWSTLGSGMNGSVLALSVLGSEVFAGGYFSMAGGAPAGYVAKWNGSGWSPVGSGVDSWVTALAASEGKVFVGGPFTKATNSGGAVVDVNRLAQWDGSTWSALGTGVNSNVTALAVSGTNLYAGGDFTTAGGITASNIARWNGSTWSTLGPGLNGTVQSLAASGNDVYAGGAFVRAGNTIVIRIAKWNGSAWSNLGSGMSRFVYALAVSGSNVYAGGDFSAAGGTVARSIARWDGSWSALGSGMNDFVHALAVSGNDLYAGGSFATTSGGSANYIARWNGSWQMLGSGMGGNETFPGVLALAVSAGNVYVGGDFIRATNAGGAAVPVNRIAKWNGSSWSSLGLGVNGSVLALAVSGSDVYAGGSFTMATNSGGGAVAVNGIAKWDGSNWTPLGSGMNAAVLALAVMDGNLFAGGYFTNAGGSAASYIAGWNGFAWSGLSSGVSGGGINPRGVRALAVSDGSLLAGGEFTTAGGIAASRVASWRDGSWSALGSGVDNTVFSLAVSGSNLYAGGVFSSAGGSAATRIAKWDGVGWSALGSGMNSTVSALAVLGTQLYAGGGFTMAGGKVSAHLARATIGEQPPSTNPPPGVVPGLYVTNAVVLPNGYAQFEVRSPSSIAYTLLYSFDLKTWNFWTVLSGTNRYVMQSPGPISGFRSLFLRLAPLGQPLQSLAFRFRTSWHGLLAGGVPALGWPQPLENWQAVLDVVNSTNLPPFESVFFNGPAGSGIVHQPTDRGPEDAYAGSYESDIFALPPSPPGGTWNVEYGAANLPFNQPDPQAASRAVSVVPRFAITNGMLHAVSWTYRNPASGTLLPTPPDFITRMSLGLYGPDFTECGADDSEIFYRDIGSPGTTNVVVSPPLLWSNLLAQFEYVDTQANTYTLNYAFGTLYEVYGANSFSFVDGCDPANSGFTWLGGATNTSTINGAYNYYLVSVPKHNLVRVDTVRGSNGSYFGTSSTSNTSDPERIGGAPDMLYATLGRTPRGFHSGGYFVIDATGLGLTSITVYVLP